MSNKPGSRETLNNRRRNGKIVSIRDLDNHPEKFYLLVEGSSDQRFYDTYKTSKNLSILYVEQLDDYPKAKKQNMYLKNKKYVMSLVKKQLDKIRFMNKCDDPAIRYGECYGIIDKDYDERINLITPYAKHLECTDLNDLETTLLYFDYDNISLNLGLEFQKSCRVPPKYIPTPELLSKALKTASILGKLRSSCNGDNSLSWSTIDIKYDNKNDSFDDIISKISNYYESIISFDISKIAERMKVSKENFKNFSSKIIPESSDLNALLYCRGHDIFNILACYVSYEEEIDNGAIQYLSILSNKKKYEETLIQIENTKHNNFMNSNVYNFLHELDTKAL